MSSNKNNDLTRCNCYCNSWTRRILITGHSEPWRHYIVSREPSLLRHGATCQGPGPALIRQGLPRCPRGLGKYPMFEERRERDAMRRGEKKDEASDWPGSEIRLYLCQSHINAPLIGHSLQQKKTFLRFHLSWQISLSVPESLLAHAREDPSPGNT